MNSTALAPLPASPPPFVVRWSARLARFLRTLSLRLAPPQFGLLERLGQSWVSHALAALVHTGLADALAEGPAEATAVANALGLDEDATFRLLRALHREGLLRRDRAGRFTHSAISAPLARHHPASLSHVARFFTAPHRTRCWEQLPQALRDGRPVWPAVHGQEPWPWYEQNPTAATDFHGAMAELTRESAPALARAYDFARHDALVDLGGGNGAFLAALLRHHPGLHGVLVDWPEVVAGAAPLLRAQGVAERVEVVGGDVLSQIPPGHPAYLAKKVLHGLDDEKAGAALRLWRDALAEGGRLLLIELVVPEGDAPFQGLLDLEMLLVSQGGRERSLSEWERLLAAQGLSLVRSWPSAAGDHVLEVARAAAPAPGR